MSDILKYLVEDDPLKTANGLIEASNFGPPERDKEIPITFSLLLICAIILALTKTLYGEAGYTFIQHFAASIIVIFVGYIVTGIIMMLVGMKYKSINNKLRCFLTCFMATITVSLLAVYFADPITDFGVRIASLVTSSDWFLGRFGDCFPALIFSLFGCAAVFWLKTEKIGELRKPRNRLITQWRAFPLYWVLTFLVFNYLAFDRGWFFDSVMKQISKIKFA